MNGIDKVVGKQSGQHARTTLHEDVVVRQLHELFQSVHLNEPGLIEVVIPWHRARAENDLVRLVFVQAPVLPTGCE